MSKNRFWMCLVEGEKPPSVRHARRAKANEEAQRLAKLNAGREVYVLEATHYFAVAAPEPVLFRTNDADEF